MKVITERELKRIIPTTDWEKLKEKRKSHIPGRGSLNKKYQEIVSKYMELINKFTEQENDLAYICYALEFIIDREVFREELLNNG